MTDIKLNNSTLATASGSTISLTNGLTLKTSASAATTSGTAHDIAIPSGVKYVTALVKNCSLVGTGIGSAGHVVLQLGNSTSFITSNYYVSGGYLSGGVEDSDAGFLIFNATWGETSQMFIAEFYNNGSDNIWFGKGQGSYQGTSQGSSAYQYLPQMAGWVDTSSELSRIRITTTEGRTFDQGSIQLLYS